jgi:hypothetical protein
MRVGCFHVESAQAVCYRLATCVQQQSVGSPQVIVSRDLNLSGATHSPMGHDVFVAHVL